MKARLIVLMLAASILAGGCGAIDGAASGSEEGAGESSWLERQFMDPLSQIQAERALLEREDLPKGFTRLPAEPEDDDSPTTFDDPDCEELMAATEGGEDDDAVAEAEATFEQGSTYFLSQSISSYEGRAPSGAFDALAEAFEECDSFSSTDADGTTMKMRVKPLDFPALGDDTLALTVRASTKGLRLTMRIVLIRVDQNLIMLVNTGTKKPMPMDGFEQIAETAVLKVKKFA